MKIVIECESFEELFEHVKKIAAGSVWDTPAPAPAEKKTRAKKTETTQALPTAAPAPEPTPAPEIMPAPVPETQAPAPAPAPTITREACAKAAAMLGRQGTITRDQLRELITSLGANSIPELPEEKLPDFAAKIRALGGSI